MKGYYLDQGEKTTLSKELLACILRRNKYYTQWCCSKFWEGWKYTIISDINRLKLWCQNISYINISVNETLLLETNNDIVCFLARFLLINYKKHQLSDLIASWSLWSRKLFQPKELSYSLNNSDVDSGPGNTFVSKKFFWFNSQFIYIFRQAIFMTNKFSYRNVLIIHT